MFPVPAGPSCPSLLRNVNSTQLGKLKKDLRLQKTCSSSLRLRLNLGNPSRYNSKSHWSEESRITASSSQSFSPLHRAICHGYRSNAMAYITWPAYRCKWHAHALPWGFKINDLDKSCDSWWTYTDSRISNRPKNSSRIRRHVLFLNFFSVQASNRSTYWFAQTGLCPETVTYRTC